MHVFALRDRVFIVAFLHPKLFYRPNLHAQLYHEIIHYEIYSLKVLKYTNKIVSTQKYNICLACAADFKTR